MAETTDAICVTLVTDTAGIGHAIVALKSLFISNRDESLDVHLIIDNADVSCVCRIKELEEFFNRKIRIHSVGNDFLTDLPPTSHKNTKLPAAANYRIKIGELLPDLNRTIYIDTDVIVKDSLRPLWDTDLKGNILAGVIDSFDHRGHCNRLRYDPADGYINSGVMLIDLRQWRRSDTSDKITRSILRNKDYIWRDQDAINDCLHGQILLLPLKYNVQQGFFLRNPDVGDQWLGQIEEARRHPVIMHYNGRPKPWEMPFNDKFPPRSRMWRDMMDNMPRTTGVTTSLPKPSLKDKIKRSVAKMMIKIHLMPPPKYGKDPFIDESEF